jgi:hypothetical protein
MKGKQAILRYLETHRTFTAKDVATECGMTINCITKNARSGAGPQDCPGEQGLANGDLSPGDAGRAGGTARSCTNGIFQECRNSPAMKRVLMVWGG